MAFGDTIFQWMGFTRYNASAPITAAAGVQELQSDINGNLKVAIAAGGAPAPRSKGTTIAVSDTVDLPGGVSSSIRTNVSGLAKVLFENDSTAVTLYLTQGVDYPYRIKRVFATGTDAGLQTAGVLHALYAS